MVRAEAGIRADHPRAVRDAGFKKAMEDCEDQHEIDRYCDIAALKAAVDGGQA